MLETIREFALERLAASGEVEATRRAYAWWCVRLAEEAGPHLTGAARAAWLWRLDTEQDNLRAALQWSLDRDEAGPGLRIVGALWVWYAVSFREGRRWAEALLALPGAAPPTVERTRALWTAGMAAWEEGDGAAVHALSEENVALSRALGDPGRLAYALAMLGNSARHDVPRMNAIFAEAQGAAEQDGDPWLVGFISLCYAIAATQLGAVTTARAQATEAVTRFRALREPWMVASSTLQLGLALLQAGEDGPARARLEECLPLLRQQRAWKWAIVALIGTGVIASRAGDAAAAGAAYGEALGLCRDTGSSAGDLAACLEGVAAAAAAGGQPARAARFLGAAGVAREAAYASTMPGFEERYGATERAVRAALGAEAYATLHADGREVSLAEAAAEARDVAGSTRPGPEELPSHLARPAGLSAREVEVLALLAAGHTNPEIARALVLSVRTVEKHVTHIYSKTGARGRADAATFALRHGLLPESPAPA
jgi:DNA-binding CsgD family transcriptional regulator